MGTKRVGLARVEALIENLKRDLNLNESRLSMATADGYGKHEMYEVVTLSTSDANDVSASLSKKLPAGCVILDAALVSVELATSDHGLVALEVHDTAIANDAASAGTEIVGEDVAGDKSVPDNDLDVSSNANNLGHAISMGELAKIDRTTAVTFFHVCSKEDQSTMTGTPKVGVYVSWVGPAAVDA